jgi:hypothetical protein
VGVKDKGHKRKVKKGGPSNPKHNKWLNKAREEANNSPKHPLPSTNPSSPGLEDIPKGEETVYPFHFYGKTIHYAGNIQS